MIRKATAIFALVIGFAAPAWAQVGIGVGVGVGVGGNATGGSASTGAATGIGNSAVVGSGNSASSSSVNSTIRNDNRDSNTNVYAPSTTIGVRSGDVRNDNRDTNINGQQQGQGQKQGQKQGQGQKQKVDGSGNSTVSIEGDRTEIPGQAPAIFSPNLVAAPETCMGSMSAGGGAGFGGTSFGINFGTTWKSVDCERRMYAKALVALGPQYVTAALVLLSNNSEVEQALVNAKIVIPGKTGPETASATIQGAVKQEKRDVPSMTDNRPTETAATPLQTALYDLGMASAIQGL